jgi:hypothetical protein
MAYSQFMTARNQFADLGSNLASIQESVGAQSVDDEFQNQQSNQFFDSVKQQVLDTGLMETVASVPAVVMGVKGLYGTLSGLKGKIVQAGEDAKALISGKLAEAKEVLSGGVSEARDTIGEGISGIRATATSAAERAGATVSEGLASASDIVGSGVASASDVIGQAAAGIRGTAGELGTEMTEFRTFARRPVSSYATEEIDTGAEAALPSISEAGSGVLSTVSDFLTGGIRNTLQSAGNAQEMILDSDPEALGAGARGFLFGVGSEAQAAGRGIAETAQGALATGSDVLASGVDTARGVLSGAADTARGVLSGAADVAETAGRGVLGTAAETGGVLAQQGSELIGGLSEGVLGTAGKLAEGAGSTFSKLAGIGSDVVGGLTGIGADLAVPVLGEVALVGSAIYGVVEGFRDLFSHPKPPTPIQPPQIQVANISQSFQSGI